MNKDNEHKINDQNQGNNTKFNSPNDTGSSPDLNAPLGYINDRPLKDELDEAEVARKAKGESPGNDVELSLNPTSENLDKDHDKDK